MNKFYTKNGITKELIDSIKEYNGKIPKTKIIEKHPRLNDYILNQIEKYENIVRTNKGPYKPVETDKRKNINIISIPVDDIICYCPDCNSLYNYTPPKDHNLCCLNCGEDNLKFPEFKNINI